MKKVLKALVALLVMVLLVSCSGGKKSTVLTQELGPMKVRMELEADGDKIVKLTQTSTTSIVDFASDATLMEQIKQEVENVKEQYSKISGVSYESTFTDKELSEKVIINTGDEKTLRAAIEAGLLPVNGENVKALSLKQTIENLENSGWKVEK